MFHRFNRNTIAGYLGLSVVVSTCIFPDTALAEFEVAGPSRVSLGVSTVFGPAVIVNVSLHIIIYQV